MARLLSDRSGDDLCEDLKHHHYHKSDDCCSDHDHDHHHHHHHKDDDCGCDDHRPRRRRKRRRRIPVGRVTVDCTPVSFETPCQARTVLSCPLTELVTVPITQTVNVQVPIGFGCVLNVPTTQTIPVQVPVTMNVPPIVTPAPTIFCTPGVLGGLDP